MIAKFILCMSLLIFSIYEAQSVVQNAQISQRIFPVLDIKKISDMYFPDAYPGSPSHSIEPGNSETAQNASFLITGEANKRVSILLPSERVILQNGQHRAKIFVTDFRSNVGQTSQLDSNGELKLFVGATREDVPTKIPSGDYSGTFYVTVLY